MTYVVVGEALLNDGTALVLYTLFYDLVKIGGETQLDPGEVTIYFVRVIIISPLIGLATGLVSIVIIGLANMRSKEEDTTIQLAITFCCAYFSFFIAQRVVGVSGVISCCAAGVMLSRYAVPRYLNAETIESVWSAVEWVGNTLLFFLAGLIIGNLAVLHIQGQDVLYILIVYLFLIAVRYITIFLLYPALYKAGKGCTTWQEATFVGWSGLRGAVGIALALSFYQSTSEGKTKTTGRDADTLIFLVGGIAALTLLINATSSKLVLLKLHLLDDDVPDDAASTVIPNNSHRSNEGDENVGQNKENKLMFEYLKKRIRLKIYNLIEQNQQPKQQPGVGVVGGTMPTSTSNNIYGSTMTLLPSNSNFFAYYLDVSFLFRHCSILKNSPEAHFIPMNYNDPVDSPNNVGNVGDGANDRIQELFNEENDLALNGINPLIEDEDTEEHGIEMTLKEAEASSEVPQVLKGILKAEASRRSGRSEENPRNTLRLKDLHGIIDLEKNLNLQENLNKLSSTHVTVDDTEEAHRRKVEGKEDVISLKRDVGEERKIKHFSKTEVPTPLVLSRQSSVEEGHNSRPNSLPPPTTRSNRAHSLYDEVVGGRVQRLASIHQIPEEVNDYEGDFSSSYKQPQPLPSLIQGSNKQGGFNQVISQKIIRMSSQQAFPTAAELGLSDDNEVSRKIHQTRPRHGSDATPLQPIKENAILGETNGEKGEKKVMIEKEKKEQEEDEDKIQVPANRLSFRMLHNIVYYHLLVTMRKAFLDILRVNYFKQINTGKLPRKSFAAIILLNSIDISLPLIKTSNDKLNDLDILIQSHYYMKKLSKKLKQRRRSELDYHWKRVMSGGINDHKKKKKKKEKKQDKDEDDCRGVAKTNKASFILTQQEEGENNDDDDEEKERLEGEDIYDEEEEDDDDDNSFLNYSVHLQTTVMILISYIESHEFAQSRIAFYLGETEGIDTPEEEIVIQESKRLVMKAKDMLLLIDEIILKYIYSKRILMSIFSLQHNLVYEFLQEGVINHKYSEILFHEIDEDMKRLERLEQKKITTMMVPIDHYGSSGRRINHCLTISKYFWQYYFEELINYLLLLRDYYLPNLSFASWDKFKLSLYDSLYYQNNQNNNHHRRTRSDATR